MAVVLIAFERESELSAIEQLLDGRGHRAVRAANGLTALDAARREPPDVIVSDIVLPRMDGFALCRKWKQDERLQSVPFVFYTRRHDDPKYERFALELGAQRFLARSVPAEELLQAIDELTAEAPSRGSITSPLPALDESALKRAEEREQALERARQAHAAALDQAQRSHAQELERARLAHAKELEQVRQSQATLHSQLAELDATMQRLAAGEARFRRVFEANPLPLWITDHATGGFIAVNDAALALYGYERAEFLALQSTALTAPTELAGEGDGIAVHRRKDGNLLAVALSAREIEFDGRAADLVAAYDLTARLAAERQLRDAAREHRAMFDAASDGMLWIDAQGKVLDVNAAYCRMSGYERAELLQKNIADLEDHGTGDTLRLRAGIEQDRYETRHVSKQGAPIDVEIGVGHCADARTERVLIVRDVTRQRRADQVQRNEQRQLEFFADLVRQSERLDESGMVRLVLDQVQSSTTSPLAYLAFVDAQAKTATLAAWREGLSGAPVMAAEAVTPLTRAGLFGDVVRAGHAVIGAPRDETGSLGLSVRHFLAAPLAAGDEIFAVLGVANRDAAYSAEDQSTLAKLCDFVGRLWHSRRSQAETLRALQRTDVAVQGMIDSFVRMSERHDPYTAGSARRVAALAVAMAREAGLDGQRQHAVRVAALLHDIGNIAVPAAILAKPAPLTETELALMRTHVEEGCQLLADIDLGGPVADIVYQHHERFDGSGYPQGVKGAEIMIEARIIGIADTVEAMCSPRPYRPAAGMDAALRELERASGSLFDPQLVTVCTRLIKERGFRLE